jgi:hypothetical protein
MKKFIIILVSLCVLGCGSLVEKSEAHNKLLAAGFTKPSCNDGDWLFPNYNGCSRDDDVAFKYSATNPAGKRVSVTVCASYWYKGTTIRY